MLNEELLQSSRNEALLLQNVGCRAYKYEKFITEVQKGNSNNNLQFIIIFSDSLLSSGAQIANQITVCIPQATCHQQRNR